MIRSADWLCHKHFGKGLDDRHVEILDPATGTGTFIVELLEHLRGNREKLAYKYKEELHANEVAILPYYVANLNIEATYHAITGQFAEFPGLVFVDTLDNVDALRIHSGHQHDLLGALADENAERIKRQNRRKISVIIGNPPYNANQENENQNNRNRAYAHVDRRIKDTYIAASSAQKTKLYDMYARFFRWASDRLADEGIIAFVTNNSFLDARTFDGFRKRVAEDFAEAWVIDLKGNARNSGERRRREGGNVFEDKIKVGVAVSFFVRKRATAPFRLHYLAVEDYAKSDEKRHFIGELDLARDHFETIVPKPDGVWIGVPDEEYGSFLPIGDRTTKMRDRSNADRAIFRLYSLGIVTNRDDWLYGQTNTVEPKAQHFIAAYESERKRWAEKYRTESISDFVDRSIKWTSELEAYLLRRKQLKFEKQRLRQSLYRPYIKLETYYARVLTHRPYQQPAIFPYDGRPNTALVFGYEKRADFAVVATDALPNKDMFMPSAAQTLPRYRYSDTGDRIDNITDWAFNKFIAHYGKKAGVTKDAIFAYCYAVLHDPVYREKYALNLKREFPRIPFYDDFAKWAGWGQRLLDLHIGYEKAKPFKFTRVERSSPERGGGPAKPVEGPTAASTPTSAPKELPPPRSGEDRIAPKPKLKSEPDKGLVIVDADTQLTGIPREAWDYRLGNRSAIDWVLDQHKEKTPRDPTVRAKFNSYRFADHKESMIDLLARVITVSLETVKITEAMRATERPQRGEAA
jgi:predicted helicase